VLRDLQDIYSCFGLTCDDIGFIRNIPADIVIHECIAAEDDAPMAEYQPGSDVLPVSTLFELIVRNGVTHLIFLSSIFFWLLFRLLGSIMIFCSFVF
jgi:hypothetical protein